MTTIAFRDGVLAGDSRVTFAGRWITGTTTKLARIDGFGFGFCGSIWVGKAIFREMTKLADKGGLRQSFIDGERIDRLIDAPKLSDEDHFDCLVISPEGELFSFEENLVPYRMEAPFAAIGSGSPFALGAMGAGASAVDAVKIAGSLDVCTGIGVETLIFPVPDKQSLLTA